MADRRAIPLPGGAVVHTAFTDVDDGDLRIDAAPADLAARRAAIAPGEWTWLDQVHGDRVVTVRRPGEHRGEPADAAVTDVPGAVLAVQTADCAGVLLWSDTGPGSAVVGAAHAGWRGLAEGVLPATVSAMRELGADRVRWALGPCISPAAYEFGEPELQLLEDRLGPPVRGIAATGRPALDLRAAVRCALAIDAVEELDAGAAAVCTAGSSRHWSWRARRDTARQAAVVHLDGPGRAG